MEETDITHADQLWELMVRNPAPLYGICTNSAFNMVSEKKINGKRKLLRFLPGRKPQLVDQDLWARWEPIDIGRGAEHWVYGKVSINPDSVGQLFSDYTLKDEGDPLIPDVFIWGNLVVSERARDLIESFAPGYCYFSPAQILGKASGRPTPIDYFHVYVRHTFYYDGPIYKESIHQPGIMRGGEVDPIAWRAFCRSQIVQKLAFDLPIFLFDRQSTLPIINSALLQHLKSEKITGLLELTPTRIGRQVRPRSHWGYETVVPLDPDYRETMKTSPLT